VSTLVFDFAINLLLTVLGVGFGWWIRGCLIPIRLTTAPSDRDTAADHAREVLSRLRDLAARVAADVGEHSHRVEEINEELTAAESHETEAVVAVVSKLVQVNTRMQEQLASAEGKLQEQARQIESHAAEARTDFLTLLANRRAFDDEIARLVHVKHEASRPFSLAIVDIDHFKRFNDSYGHQAGDEVLRRVARVLCACTREGDVAARYGGEEFAVLFPNTRIEQAQQLVEQIRESVDLAYFRFAGNSLHVTASLGVAEALGGEDAAGLIQRSDAALYAAKEAGRNQAQWHDGKAIHPVAPRQVTRHTVEPSLPPAGEEPAAKRDHVATKEPASSAKSEVQRSESDASNPLSRLVNRTAFCSVLSNRLAECRRGSASLAVILARIDHFDRVVGVHGQTAGQIVQRTLAHFLVAAVREMDTVAYYDNVTYAMLLPNTALVSAALVCERLRRAVAASALPLGGRQVSFTISLGGAEANEGDDLERILRRSELALDCASKAGGNNSFYHNGQWSETAAAFVEHAAGNADNP
jgi:diguanylate cyclase